MSGRLLAISDLHVGHAENRQIVERLRPESARSWLLLAGDVGAQMADVEWALRLLRDRFELVVWTPGNHELWTPPSDPVDLRGEARYRHLVDLCRSLGILTPEDPYAVWEGEGGPVTVVPLFVLYDYTFRPDAAASQEEAMRLASAAGVVCSDERLLHPDPHPTREAWCRHRIAASEERLDSLDHTLPTVLVNHFPLVRDPTRILRHPEFAQWCGSVHTASGTGATGPPPSSTDTFTSRARPATTACRFARSRSATRANGAAARSRSPVRGRWCRAGLRPSAESGSAAAGGAGRRRGHRLSRGRRLVGRGSRRGGGLACAAGPVTPARVSRRV